MKCIVVQIILFRCLNEKLTKTSKIVIWIIVIIVFIAFCIWQNNSIVVSHFVYHNSKLPADFNDYKIVHISDLHNKMFEKSNLAAEPDETCHPILLL